MPSSRTLRHHPHAATPSATNQGHKKRAQSTNSLMNSMGSLEATEGAAATGGAGAASGLYGAASAGAGGSEAVYGGADLGSAEVRLWCRWGVGRVLPCVGMPSLANLLSCVCGCGGTDEGPHGWKRMADSSPVPWGQGQGDK